MMYFVRILQNLRPLIFQCIHSFTRKNGARTKPISIQSLVQIVFATGVCVREREWVQEKCKYKAIAMKLGKESMEVYCF